VDEFWRFGDNTSYSVNFRPDIRVFPFFNVFAIFGAGSSTTKIILNEPVSFESTVAQRIQTSGFGLMGAFGIGTVWTSIDANRTWNKPELLDEPVLVRGLGIRFGKTFAFHQHPKRNIAFWAGARRVKIEASTIGQIRPGDALPFGREKMNWWPIMMPDTNHYPNPIRESWIKHPYLIL
jgi:opacity protein-like surface antigen